MIIGVITFKAITMSYKSGPNLGAKSLSETTVLRVSID